MRASIDDVEARDRQCELLRVAGKLGKVLVPQILCATVIPSCLAGCLHVFELFMRRWVPALQRLVAAGTPGSESALLSSVLVLPEHVIYCFVCCLSIPDPHLPDFNNRCRCSAGLEESEVQAEKYPTNF